MNTRFKTLLLACGSFCAADLFAEPLPEIVVSADFRGDTTLETAGSVAVMSEQSIKSRGAQHFEDIIHAFGNVNSASGSNRARFFQIRGIGERSQFVNPINPSVGILIDDVDFSGAGAIATLMDVEQVEVLRGPQGTRYGANALAGLINIKTREPDDDFYADIKVTAAEYDSKTYGIVFNTPLREDLNLRVVAESHESDGYIQNDFLDRDDVNHRDEQTIRAKLNWQVQDNWNIGFTLANVDIDNGYDAFSLDNTRRTLSDEPGFDRQDSTYLSIKSKSNFDRLDMEVLLNRSDSDLAYGYDEDWSFTGIHPFGYTSTDYYFRDRETTSLELRLKSNESSRILGDSTDWVVGLYSLRSEERLLREYTFAGGDFSSDYDFDTLALFAQFDISLGEKLLLGIGARLEERDTEYRDSEAVSFSPSDSLWGGKVSLEYQISDNSLGYVSVARGYKAGGFNVDGSLDEDLRSFDEEYLIEYEIGLKSLLAEDQLSLQLVAFYNDRKDQQVKSSLVRQRADGSTEFVDYLGNAAEGTNRGIEVDVDWLLTENLTLTLSAGWLDAEFDEFINEFGEDLSGRDQAHAPGYTYNVGLVYEQGPWSATLSSDGRDEFFFSDRHSVKSDSYQLVNASLKYTTNRWSISLWGRNLGDEDYYVRAFGSFGNDPRKNYATEPYFQFGEPRVTGLTLEFSLSDLAP